MSTVSSGGGCAYCDDKAQCDAKRCEVECVGFLQDILQRQRERGEEYIFGVHIFLLVDEQVSAVGRIAGHNGHAAWRYLPVCLFQHILG